MNRLALVLSLAIIPALLVAEIIAAVGKGRPFGSPVDEQSLSPPAPTAPAAPPTTVGGPLKAYQVMANGAVIRYEAARAKAAADYSAALDKARTDATAGLADALSQATKAGDFDAAMAIKAKSAEIEAGQEGDPKTSPLDNSVWQWSWTHSGGGTHVMTFKAGAYGALDAGTWGCGYWRMTGPRRAEIFFGTSPYPQIADISADARTFIVQNASGGPVTGALVTRRAAGARFGG